MKIYNSLTRKKEAFKPINRGKVKMYVCGVTVYDECHIGHLRSLYITDLFRRYLRFRGYKVKFVRNITDVDDKIIAKAKQEIQKDNARAKNKEADIRKKTREVARRYIKRYYEDMQTLGIERADIEPKATEHIEDMVKIIKGLINKGFAYQWGEDVYFQVSKFADYGALSHQDTGKLREGLKAKERAKRDPLDFALWKGAKTDEPSWQSPWGRGRPGWHIECSAMSMKYLGKNFDIHCGGRDLIFPHHENEIAQSESYTGVKFVNFWVHNGLLTIRGEKMSKSLGNFLSVKDFIRRNHPETLKIFFLSAHYASPIDFTYDAIEKARRARERFYVLFDKIDKIKVKGKRSKVEGKRACFGEVDEIRKEFQTAMDDDFNTPQALGALFSLLNLANRALEKGNLEILPPIKEQLLNLGGVLGLFGESVLRKRRQVKALEGKMSPEAIQEEIRLRQEYRDKGEFAQADEIRRRLLKKDIILEDQKDGSTTWRVKPR